MTAFRNLPLVFLAIAAFMGVLLRWHLADPFQWLVYGHWLHAHSHVMFLGWVFNALSVSFVLAYVPKDRQPAFRILFLLINLLVAAMLVCFPLYGYNALTIALSTLHTLVVVWFMVRFMKILRTTQSPGVSAWFVKAALGLFLVSALGPFIVGGLSASGRGQTDEYFLAVYYYLHFQYNGVFTFGTIGLMYRFIESHSGVQSESLAKKGGWWLLVSCFPAYLLSTLWTQPGLVLNVIGGAAALGQGVGFWYLIRSVRKGCLRADSRFTNALLVVGVASFALKLVLQFMSAFPAVARLAYENRMFMIAYLHLVLIGTLTLPLLGWYHENGWTQVHPVARVLLITGFVLSEVFLLGMGLSWPVYWGQLISSVVLAVAFAHFAWASRGQRRDVS